MMVNDDDNVIIISECVECWMFLIWWWESVWCVSKTFVQCITTHLCKRGNWESWWWVFAGLENRPKRKQYSQEICCLNVNGFLFQSGISLMKKISSDFSSFYYKIPVLWNLPVHSSDGMWPENCWFSNFVARRFHKLNHFELIIGYVCQNWTVLLLLS